MGSGELPRLGSVKLYRPVPPKKAKHLGGCEIAVLTDPREHLPRKHVHPVAADQGLEEDPAGRFRCYPADDHGILPVFMGSHHLQDFGVVFGGDDGD
jgi:hypothetical protein